ncbi:hypothetical protein JTE90_004662 [Oedothorax gibbosus]|uniref:Uncharacterized protein n=1 Tax=Oedothorax gibbosus TaxID=931172 RepID=A0AAV6UYB6_9ARAC|nr:hypothetical protein JTE90_004662 [Oedothorax gibbosus]
MMKTQFDKFLEVLTRGHNELLVSVEIPIDFACHGQNAHVYDFLKLVHKSGSCAKSRARNPRCPILHGTSISMQPGHGICDRGCQRELSFWKKEWVEKYEHGTQNGVSTSNAASTVPHRADHTAVWAENPSRESIKTEEKDAHRSNDRLGRRRGNRCPLGSVDQNLLFLRDRLPRGVTTKSYRGRGHFQSDDFAGTTLVEKRRVSHPPPPKTKTPTFSEVHSENRAHVGGLRERRFQTDFDTLRRDKLSRTTLTEGTNMIVEQQGAILLWLLAL